MARIKAAMTPNTTAAWRRRRVIRPNIQTQAIGRISMASISTTLVSRVGFSKGWAELGPK